MKTRGRNAPWLAVTAAATFALGACGSDRAAEPDGGADEVTTSHCAYQPMSPGANAGGEVVAGALSAGAAEGILDIPVGTALGGYTARAEFLGSAGQVDQREVEWAAGFNPSIGVESAPRVKVLVLSADTETVVLVKIDSIFPYEAMTLDIADELGTEFAGKVLVSASHSHSAWGQHTGHTAYQLGASVMREKAYRAYVDTAVRLAKQALDERRPARLGILHDPDFDPADQINRDRRGENDLLPGGESDDHDFYVLRVDGVEGEPIAVVPIYGVHGTLMSEDNSFASTDSTGAMERVLEEKFDSEVVVMHLQGAGGDVSPRGHGGLDCQLRPGAAGDPCFDWAVLEGHGRVAADLVYQAWEAAGADMEAELALEMLTRSVPLGPDAATFSIRGGELAYAPFERQREADGVIANSGQLLSPIDEFNAPVGAAMCEGEWPLYPVGGMPGTEGLAPYGSCVHVDAVAGVIGDLADLHFETGPTQPVCQSTRTLVSALRIGDHVIGTIPGELTVLLADRVRQLSPVEPAKTIVLGYSQGFTGYSLTPEDWLAGGYEASTNLWGPLEAEYLAERTLALMDLAVTSEREDGAAGGADRIATPSVVDDVPVDDPAPQLGTVPDSVPDAVWWRSGARASAQPDAVIERVAGHAVFTWIGEDPLAGTPVVTLQREIGDGVFEDVRRRSGRVVRDAEQLLSHTPQPLRRGDGPQTHYWSVEWQAVPWLGAAEDGLDAVAGVPTGRYRFHVEGSGYQLDSEPFEVTTASLGLSANLAGSELSVSASVHAPRGYRLLDLVAHSNAPVPLRGHSVTVSVSLEEGGPLVFEGIELDEQGSASVDLGDQAGNATSVTLTDRFGNAGVQAL